MLTLLFIAVIPAFAAESAKTNVSATHRDAFARPFDEQRLRRYISTLPRDGDYFVVEGDMLLTETEVRVYVAGKSAGPVVTGPELIVNNVEGKPDFWQDVAKRTLTYAVDRKSFPSEEKYRMVSQNMEAAGAQWEAACTTCQVRFSHVSSLDMNALPGQVVFVVRYYDSGRQYIAASFFPSYPIPRRYLNVDPSYFSTQFNKVGVLRHELGHVLGYRHEHIQGIAGCYQEGGQWQPLTSYDPKSAMHYFCGGAGTMELALTELDKTGHRTLYKVGQ